MLLARSFHHKARRVWNPFLGTMGNSQRPGPELPHRILQMRREHLRHAVQFVEAAHGQILDEARAVDAAQDLIAFLVGTERGPAGCHVSSPENVGALDDQAIRPDLDRAIDLDRLSDDQPVDDRHGEQAGDVEPHGVNRRMVEQIPTFEPGRCRPREYAPERVAKAQIEVLVDDEDAALGREEAAIVDIRVRLEPLPGRGRERGCRTIPVGNRRVRSRDGSRRRDRPSDLARGLRASLRAGEPYMRAHDASIISSSPRRRRMSCKPWQSPPLRIASERLPCDRLHPFCGAP